MSTLDHVYSYNEITHKKSLSRTLLDIVDWSTFHALPNVVKAPRVIFKILYICAFLASTVFFLNKYLITKDSFIFTYLAYETDTVVQTVRVSEAKFPAITICSLEVCGFEYNYGKELEEFITIESQRDTEARKAIESRLASDKTKANLFWARERFLVSYDDTDLNVVLQNESQSFGRMLISCKFDGKPCSESDFEFFQMGEFQKCFKFNANLSEVRNIRRFNLDYGLKLELFVGEPDKCRSPLATAAGLNIYVHNQTSTPTLDDDTILIQQGFETNIAVDRTFVNRQPEPYSDCIPIEDSKSYLDSDKELVRQTFELNKLYQQQYCLSLCYQKFLLKYCDCYDHALPFYDKDPASEGKESCPIFVDSTYNCIYVAKKLFYNGKNDAPCNKACPSECEVTLYSTTVSKSIYPTKTYQSVLNKNAAKNATLDKESILALNIYYQSGEYIRIAEKPTTDLERFISEFGGVIGLFLGGGILSLLEILEALLQIIIYQIEKLMNKKKPISQSKLPTSFQKTGNQVNQLDQRKRLGSVTNRGTDGQKNTPAALPQSNYDYGADFQANSSYNKDK